MTLAARWAQHHAFEQLTARIEVVYLRLLTDRAEDRRVGLAERARCMRVVQDHHEARLTPLARLARAQEVAHAGV